MEEVTTKIYSPELFQIIAAAGLNEAVLSIEGGGASDHPSYKVIWWGQNYVAVYNCKFSAELTGKCGFHIYVYNTLIKLPSSEAINRIMNKYHE